MLAAMLLPAQSTTQQISGTVKDGSGAVIPSAKVSVLHINTGQTRNTGVNESGYYVVTNIPLGDYEVTAEAPGFKKWTQKNVKVDINAKATVDATLEVGAVSESVTVSADSAQIETSNGDVGRLITGQQATNLQLNGRNFTQLLSLIPGVATTNRSAMDLFGGYGSNMSSQSANGGRTDTFSWNIDGVDNKDNGGGGNNFVNINPDAIAEFKVLTTNYSAEYGQNAGAIINLAMKSGTREFHGGAYEYVRNDAFDARAFNAITKQKLRFNNWGWNLGGPVYIPGKFNTGKNKLFLFGGMEFKRYAQGAINTWTVPTVALRGGDFSSLAASQWPKDPLTGQVFANGIVPASRISKNMARLIQNYPLPNFTGSGGNYVFPTTAPNNSNQYMVKGDYLINDKHQLSVHYLRDYYTNLNNLTSLVTYTRKIPGTNAKAQWTWVASPTTVNTVQFSFSGNVILQGDFAANPVFTSDYTRKGEGLTLPMIYGRNGTIPSLNISGYNGLGASDVNWNNFNRLFNWKDDFSKLIGNHNLKAGILVLRSRKNQDNWPGRQRHRQLRHRTCQLDRQRLRGRADRQLFAVHRSGHQPRGLVPLHPGGTVHSGRLEGEQPSDAQPGLPLPVHAAAVLRSAELRDVPAAVLRSEEGAARSTSPTAPSFPARVTRITAWCWAARTSPRRPSSASPSRATLP